MSSESVKETRRNVIKKLGIATGGLIGVAAGGLVVGGAGAYFAREPEVSSLRGKVDAVTLQSFTNVLAQNTRGDRLAFLSSLSQAKVVNGVAHGMDMEGGFRFNPDKREAEGGGGYVHVNLASPVPPIDFGKWEVKKLVSYTRQSPPAIWGRIEASVVDIEINLLPEFGPVAGQVIPASLRCACNIAFLGPAGFTGQSEGFQLTIPGTPFGTFAPFDVPTAPGFPFPFIPLGLLNITIAG